MHPKENLLRAFIDRELSQEQARQVKEHLEHCPACQNQLATLRGRAILVHSQLDHLAPGPRQAAQSPQAAFQRFRNPTRSNQSRKESISTMFTRRPLWTALAVIAVLAISLTITPVRAWASDVLSIFRVQKITVVQFDPNAVEKAQTNMESNRAAIEQVFKDNVKITEKGQYQEVASADQAAQVAGFTPRLPSGLKDAKLAVKPGFHGELTIDQPKMQALMDAAGVDVKLPASVNGKTVVADVSSAVVETQGCPTAAYGKEALPEGSAPNCTVFIQMPSPVLDTPEGLDVKQLGQAMFQFLGLPKEQAASLANSIDWATTLVLPIPQGKGFSYQDVQVDGVSGTLLQSTDEPGYMLVWVKNGVIYGLRGPGSAQDGLALAASIK